jgi:fatty-acyl-CoA synthase
LQGYCDIVGRIKDMIIRAGEYIYPREIEAFLPGHPEVQDRHVFGVPDEKYGDELCAWIRLPTAPPWTKNYCRDRIAHYKVPRHVRFVAEFPMTVTGRMRPRMSERCARTGDRLTSAGAVCS